LYCDVSHGASCLSLFVKVIGKDFANYVRGWMMVNAYHYCKNG
jgi:hypothetical protein